MFTPGCDCCCEYCIDPGPSPTTSVWRVTISGVANVPTCANCGDYNASHDLTFYTSGSSGGCPYYSYRKTIGFSSIILVLYSSASSLRTYVQTDLSPCGTIVLSAAYDCVEEAWDISESPPVCDLAAAAISLERIS